MPGTDARRHRALVGAIVLLAVALAIAAAALLDRERAMQQLSREQVYWSVAQTEIELYRFIAALEAHGRGDPETDHADVVRRFDIFWSRMRLFEAGDVANRVRAFPGADAALADTRAVMESEEAAVMGLERADVAEIGRIHRRFDEAGLALHRLAIAVNQGETAMLARLREQLRTEIFALVAIVGGMVSGGSVLVVLLVRENRRSRELGLATRQFAAAADASERGIVLCRRQGDLLAVVYANGPFRALAGEGTIEGTDPSALFARRLGLPFVAPLEQALAERRSVVSGELPLERDGERHWRRLHITPVEGDDGDIDALMVSVEDVDLEVAARREIESARDAAMRANASKSRFVAVMSHEIRTPMNGVLGALGLIAQRNRDRELDGLIGTARASGEALLSILNDVLDITRMEADQLRLDPGPVDLTDLVRSVGAAWAPLAAEKGVALDCTVAPDVSPHVMVDGTRLRQMLVNLVANAIKFTDAGHIDISVVQVARRADGKASVRFEVADSGLGIAPGDRERLFREYDQVAQHSRGGTGLGLAIVRRLAELMGGHVGVDSAPGKGSRFFFELPLMPSAAPARQAPRQALSLDGLDVLVAEDNATNRLIISEILKDLGCRVRVAENGADAVAMVEQAAPDIVLMDIAMPVMDGHEAHRRLRAGEGARAGLPVVALTAYAMADEVAGFLAEGFDAVLPKPVVREALAEALARLTGRGRVVRHHPAPASPASALDRAALEHLMRSLGPETAGHLVESFVVDVEQALVRLEAALPHGDLAQVERDSHMLAGLAATFGLEGLTLAARVVNASCRAGREVEALEGAAELVAAGRQGLEAFRRLTSEPGFATLAAATG